MYQRLQLQVLTKRLQEPRRFIQVLMGLRQVGKTTLVLQLVDNANLPFHFASADAVAATNMTWLE